MSILHLKLTNEATYVRSNQGDSKHLEAQYARYTEVHILSCCTIVPSPVSSMHSRPRECGSRNDEGTHILSDAFQSSSGGYSFRETYTRKMIRKKARHKDAWLEPSFNHLPLIITIIVLKILHSWHHDDLAMHGHDLVLVQPARSTLPLSVFTMLRLCFSLNLKNIDNQSCIEHIPHMHLASTSLCNLDIIILRL